MNRNFTLASLSLVAVCGLALAQNPAPQTAGAKLEALQKDVAALQEEVAALKQRALPAKPGGAAQAPQDNGLEKLAADAKVTRRLVEQLVGYVQAQSDSAAELATILADSEKKGFTYGINPDSRIVLLGGLNSFVATLQENVPALMGPEPLPTGTPAPPARAKQ